MLSVEGRVVKKGISEVYLITTTMQLAHGRNYLYGVGLGFVHGYRVEMTPKEAECITSRALSILSSLLCCLFKTTISIPSSANQKIFKLPYAVIKFYSNTTFTTVVSNFVLRI